MSDKSTDRAAKQKLEPTPESCIIIDQPLVRDYSTGGGHGPEDTLVEGDEKLVTRKWQGYPPQNLNLIGKPHPAMPEVGIPRLTGKAEYTSRVVLPNLLYIKLLTNPHPRAKIKTLDVSSAQKMPPRPFAPSMSFFLSPAISSRRWLLTRPTWRVRTAQVSSKRFTNGER